MVVGVTVLLVTAAALAGSGTRLDALVKAQDWAPLGVQWRTSARSLQTISKRTDHVAALESVDNIWYNAGRAATDRMCSAGPRSGQGTDGSEEPVQHPILMLKQTNNYWVRTVIPNGNEHSMHSFVDNKFQDMYRSLQDASLYPSSARHPQSTFPKGPNVFITWVNSKQGPTRQPGSDLINKDRKVASGATFRLAINLPQGIITILQADNVREKVGAVGMQGYHTAWTNDQLNAHTGHPADLRGALATEWYAQTGQQPGLWHDFIDPRFKPDDFQRRLRHIVVSGTDMTAAAMSTIARCLASRHRGNVIPQWPGEEFEIGDPCFTTLLAVDVASAAAVSFLYGNKAEFGRKIFTTVKIFSLDPAHEEQKVSLVWKIADWTQAYDDEARARIKS